MVHIKKKKFFKEEMSYQVMKVIEERTLHECSVAKSCTTLCNPKDYSPADFFVHRIYQARILEWAAISFSRGSSRPRD